jgi:Antirepressor regulating drug resistance, predicted signal transduction N-terminal membrane component
MTSLALFADFLWKLLIITSLSSAIIFGVFCLVQSFLRKTSGRLFNKVAQISISTVLGTVILSTVLLLSVDQDIQEKCFGSFASAQGSFGVTRVLALVWFVGVVAFAAFDFVRVMRFKRFLNQSVLRDEAGYSIVSDELAPLSFGFLRPQIVLPETVASDVNLKDIILNHEQTHVANRDGLWTGLAMIVSRLCWFNPLAMGFERVRRLAMEMATDEEVISKKLFSASEYASAMLQVLELNSAKRTPGFVMGAAAEFKEMKFRLENLRALELEKPMGLRFAVLAVMMLGWGLGISEAFASMNLNSAESAEVNMCYQVQHEKIIERVLNMEATANKCE